MDLRNWLRRVRIHMAKGTVTKVMKYELRYLSGFSDFHAMQQAVWGLQRQSREILTKTIQMAFHWDYISRENFNANGVYLDVKAETGYKTYDGYIYNSLKSAYADMAAANLNAAIQKAWKKYKDAKMEVLRGTMSTPSYRSDQPVLISKNCVKLFDGGVRLTLFSDRFKRENNLNGNLEFAVQLHDGTQRSIFANLLNGTYALGQCQLVYDKRKWFLLVTYIFTPEKRELDPEKILGVDLGQTYALYASSVCARGTFRIEGGEAAECAHRLEQRKRSLQQQARFCGEGRVGHGTKTRVAAVYSAGDKIASYRDSINHRYSKALVEYAVKNGYGTIQMEDLTGIQNDLDHPKRLQHWTYYDLQTKIENKAKEHGVGVVKVNPRYTSQRCSRCGHIERENRPTQKVFCCKACGFEGNADYNASQNLSMRNIDKIIEKELSAKGE